MSSPMFTFVPAVPAAQRTFFHSTACPSECYHSDGESSMSSVHETRSPRSVSPCSSVDLHSSPVPSKLEALRVSVLNLQCKETGIAHKETPCNAVDLKQDDAISALLMMSHAQPVVHVVSRKRKEISRQCQHCERCFDDASNFRAHLRTHTGEKPFVCEFPGCAHRFASSSNLIVHRRLHTGERPYACTECSLSFVDSGALNKHRRIHTGEKPYICNVEGCSQAFARSGDLTVHKRVHTGEKPFECTTCHKTYTQRSSLKAHVKMHSQSDSDSM